MCAFQHKLFGIKFIFKFLIIFQHKLSILKSIFTFLAPRKTEKQRLVVVVKPSELSYQTHVQFN